MMSARKKGNYYITHGTENGITLKRYIDKRKRLSTREAVTVAIQVTMGHGYIPYRGTIPSTGKLKPSEYHQLPKKGQSQVRTSNREGLH